MMEGPIMTLPLVGEDLLCARFCESLDQGQNNPIHFLEVMKRTVKNKKIQFEDAWCLLLDEGVSKLNLHVFFSN